MRFHWILSLVPTAVCLAFTASAAQPKKPAPALDQVVIQPKNVEPPKPAPTTGFKLAHSGGKLMVSFFTKDPTLQLDTRSPLVIQLDANEPLQIEPSVITKEGWPKQGNTLALKYRGAQKNQAVAVVLTAAYQVCSSKTKKCRKERARETFQFKP